MDANLEYYHIARMMLMAIGSGQSDMKTPVQS